MTPLSILIIVLLVTLLVGHSLFIFRYASYSPWRATWQGITLMSQTVTLALLVLFFIIDIVVIGDWPLRGFLLVLFLGLLSLESLIAALCLIYVQRQSTPVTPRQGTGFVHPDNIEGDNIMSNLDPYEYKNGQKITALAVGETVTSDSPKVELGNAKAVVAAVTGLVVAVAPVLTATLGDGSLSLNDGILLGLAVLAGLGVPGIGTYLAKTTVTGK